jgi:hypothetical protein
VILLIGAEHCGAQVHRQLGKRVHEKRVTRALVGETVHALED